MTILRVNLDMETIEQPSDFPLEDAERIMLYGVWAKKRTVLYPPSRIVSIEVVETNG